MTSNLISDRWTFQSLNNFNIEIKSNITVIVLFHEIRQCAKLHNSCLIWCALLFHMNLATGNHDCLKRNL